MNAGYAALTKKKQQKNMSKKKKKKEKKKKKKKKKKKREKKKKTKETVISGQRRDARLLRNRKRNGQSKVGSGLQRELKYMTVTRHLVFLLLYSRRILRENLKKGA